MTITNTLIETVSALGNGSNKNFTITFAFQANSQIKVYLQDESTTPYTRTLQTLTTHYTISGGDPGTTVVMVSAPTVNQRVIIKRVTALTQTVDYVETQAFPAEDHEEQMDKNVQMLQEAQGLAAKKIGLADASTATVPTFPDPLANRFPVYKDDASDLTVAPSASATIATGDVMRFDGDSWENSDALTTHIANTSNPHAVTAAQTAFTPAGTVAATDVQAAIVEVAGDAAAATATVSGDLASHIADAGNPHSVTAAQVGNGTAQWNANKLLGKTLSLTGLTDGDVLHYDGGADEFHPVSSPLGPDPTYDTVGLTTGLPDPAHVEGRLFYDDAEKCLSYYNENTAVKVNIGQEEHIRATNKTGAALPNGTIVYVDGAQGNRPTIAKARANAEATCEGTIGMVTADIADNATGYVTTLGLVHDVDTSAHAEGTVLYVSEATAGLWTATRPTGTNLAVMVGVVTRQHATLGHILIAPRWLGTLNPTLTGLTGSVVGTNPRLFTALNTLENRQQTSNGIENPSAFSIAYNATTRVFTVTYTGTGYVWVSGVRFAKTGSESTTAHANSTGKWFLYYDAAGALTVSSTSWDVLTTAPLIQAYYRTDAKAILFDERHPAGAGMPDATHKYLHENVGTVLGVGAIIDQYTLNSNANLPYRISSVTLKDEDLEFSIAQSNDNTSRLIFYVDGAGGTSWNWTSNIYGIMSNGTLPDGNIYYNNVAAGTLVAQTNDNDYVNYWPIALQFYAEVNGAVQTPMSPGYAVIMGQAEHTTLPLAQAVTPASLLYIGNLTSEGNVFARITYNQTGAGDDIVIETDPVYYRTSVNSLTSVGFTPTDHQTLTNRSAYGAHPGTAIALNVTTTAVDLTLDTATHDYVNVTATCNITLPTAAAGNTGRTMTIDNAGSGATVTIIGTVSGITNPTLEDNQVMQVISTGSAWRAI